MQGLFRTVASWWCESFIGTYEAKEVVKHHSGFTRLQVPFIRVDDHGLCFINFWFSIFFSIFDSPRGNGWGLRQSSGSAWTSKLDLCRSQCHAERPKVWSMWSSNAMQLFFLAWPLSICDFFVAFWPKKHICFPTYSQVVLCVQRLSLHSIHHSHKNINSNMWKRKVEAEDRY